MNADVRADRWLRSFGPSNAHTLSLLSSPTVMRCSNSASTDEKRIGPDFKRSAVHCSSKSVVDPPSFPVLISSLV